MKRTILLLHNLVYSKLFTTDRTIHRFLSAILWIVSSASAGALASQLVIDNVSVVDVTTGQVLSRRSVLIEGGQIVSVTRSDDRQILRSGRIVDASGKYLIPGLWDMHVHTSSDRISREIILPLLIAHGVTGIRSMAADCFENHTPRCDESSPPYATIYQVEEWRLEISSQALIGPQIVASSIYTNGPDIHEKSTIYNPGTVQDATTYVELLYERGVDLIKIYDNVPRDAYFALAEAANRLGMPFAGHVPFSISASEAARAGQQSIEHVSGLIEECSSKEVTLKRRLEDDQGWSNYFRHHEGDDFQF